MLLLGLLLVGATAAFAGLLIADNDAGGPSYAVSVLGHQVATLNTLEAFLAGAALALVFALGLALMRRGARYAVRRRSDLRSARRDARSAAAERDLLAARARGDEAAGRDPTAPADPADPAAPDAGSGSRRRHGRHLFGH